MSISKFIKSINPFKRTDSNTKNEYVIQKVLAFALIYISAAIIVEVMVLLLFTALGYNFMQGEMPSGIWVDFLPLYGFIGFGFITILYVKKIEKRDLSAIKVCLNAKFFFRFIVNFIFGSALVAICILVLVTTGYFEFLGFGKIDGAILIIGIIAYIIQGIAEELMCRGFLQTSLNRKTSTGTAILISATLFTLPHISSIIGRSTHKWIKE